PSAPPISPFPYTTLFRSPEVRKVLSSRSIQYLQRQINLVEVAPLTVTYVARLVRATRPGDVSSPKFARELIDWGAGPRAGQYLIDRKSTRLNSSHVSISY